VRFIYLVVEGPHDVSIIGRILKLYDIQIVTQIEDLDNFWIEKRMIPRDFPIEGNLLRRVPVPTFFQSETISVAVQSAGGDSKILNTLKLTLANIDYEDLHSFAIFLDADTRYASERLFSYRTELSDVPLLQEVRTPGEIIFKEGIRAGVFVFPNNESQGTLENILLECANVVYPTLLMAANEYVSGVSEEFSNNWGISDKNKIVVGCIANVLKPGKANQVSLQDNKWISGPTLDLPAIIELNKFINGILSE
jgi:hypothetical protein